MVNSTFKGIKKIVIGFDGTRTRQHSRQDSLIVFILFIAKSVYYYLLTSWLATRKMFPTKQLFVFINSSEIAQLAFQAIEVIYVPLIVLPWHRNMNVECIYTRVRVLKKTQNC